MTLLRDNDVILVVSHTSGHAGVVMMPLSALESKQLYIYTVVTLC